MRRQIRRVTQSQKSSTLNEKLGQPMTGTAIVRKQELALIAFTQTPSSAKLESALVRPDRALERSNHFLIQSKKEVKMFNSMSSIPRARFRAASPDIKVAELPTYAEDGFVLIDGHVVPHSFLNLLQANHINKLLINDEVAWVEGMYDEDFWRTLTPGERHVAGLAFLLLIEEGRIGVLTNRTGRRF